MVTPQKVVTLDLTPNAVRYGINLQSKLVDGALKVMGGITLQRAETTTADGVTTWKDDPSIDGRKIVAFQDMDAWLTDLVTKGKVQVATAQNVAAAWVALDAAVDALNADLKLV